MKIIKFLMIFIVIFLVFGSCLLLRLDSNYYTELAFHLFKPNLNFFQVFNLIYVVLISLSLTEIIYIYKVNNLTFSIIFKVLVNLISFLFIRVFFYIHNLLLTFICSIILFISLLYIYEEITYLNEKSTRYLDINVLYSLLLSAFTFCLYVLNSI